MSRSRLLSSLVTVQVALSLLLLVGAGLFLRTMQNLESLDPGFRPEGVLLISLDGRRTAFPKEQLDELRAIPGVIAASLSTHTPLSGATWTDPAGPAEQPLPDRDNAYFIASAPAFFRTLGTPLLAGREFTERDSLGAPFVAIVNQAYASRYFPAVNPMGRHLTAVVRGRPTDLEIVGVAKDVDLAGLRRQPPPAVYVPYYQLPSPDPARKYDPGFPTTLEIRAAGGFSRIGEEVRRRLRPHMPNEALEIGSLTAQVEATFVQERLIASLGTMFGVLAMVLAFVGLYGLLAYDVARRTREMGIRIALGARQSRVIAMVVKRAALLVVAGVGVGLPAALIASRWVESMLFGLKAGDPVTIIAAVLLLVVAGILAAFLPARRAVGIDPMRALRHE